LDARLSGGFVVDAAGAGELRRILGLESINASLLIGYTRSLVQRIDLLTARLNGARMVLDNSESALPNPAATLTR
jgi:hypothetical protein